MVKIFARLWLWLHFLCVVAIVLQPSTPATILGRYSPVAVAFLGIFLALTPVVWWTTRHLHQWLAHFSTLSASAGLIVAGALLMSFLMWWVDFGYGTNSYLIARLYSTFLLAGLIGWSSTHWTPTVQLSRWVWVISVGFCFLMVVVASRFPTLLWTDEGFTTTVAVNLNRLGTLQVAFWRPTLIESSSLVYVGLAAWFQAFGVSLSSGRLFIYAMGLAGTAFIFATVRRMYSSLTGYMVVVLVGLALLALNTIRTDTGVMLWLSVAFYLYVVAEQTNRPHLHSLVGLTLILCLDSHPNSYRFVVAFGLAYVVEYGLRLRHKRRFFVDWSLLYLMAGGLIGFGVFYAFYAVVTPTFTELASSPFFPVDPANIPAILMTQLNGLLGRAPLLGGIAALGLILAIRRNQSLDRLIVILLAMNAIIFITLYGPYRDYYLLHLIPMMALLAASVLHEVEKRTQPASLVGILLLITVASLGWLTHGLSGDRGYSEALDVADRIRALVPKDAVFVGVDPFYLNMSDYPNFVELNAASFVALYDELDMHTAWEKIAPTAITIVNGYPIQVPEGLREYVDIHDMKRVACWKTTSLGDVELYMKNPLGESYEGECQAITG